METQDLNLQILALEKRLEDQSNQLNSVIADYELRLDRLENVAIRLYTNPMEKELRDYMRLIRMDKCGRE